MQPLLGYQSSFYLCLIERRGVLGRIMCMSSRYKKVRVFLEFIAKKYTRQVALAGHLAHVLYLRALLSNYRIFTDFLRDHIRYWVSDEFLS